MDPPNGERNINPRTIGNSYYCFVIRMCLESNGGNRWIALKREKAAVCCSVSHLLSPVARKLNHPQPAEIKEK